MSKVSLGDDSAADVLMRLLDLHAARQKVAAKNLANTGTEDYEPKTVRFTDEFDRAIGRVSMRRTDERHIVSPRAATRSEGFVEVVDEEAVASAETNLEASVAEIADAEMAYATVARLMSKRVATIRTAISGRP
jgi:flagellar basal-body rod protein FlgB